MKENSDSKKKKIIAVDTAKCMAIAATLMMLLNFGRGKTHYLKYASVGILGSVFGFTYSFYFSSRKIIGWKANELIL
jgi:hypothetical protein